MSQKSKDFFYIKHSTVKKSFSIRNIYFTIICIIQSITLMTLIKENN